MIQASSKPGAGALSQSGPHDEFLELCAASTSGELTDDEQKRLREHLAICASCREALQQYESIVSDVIPAIAAGEEPEHVQTAGTWSQEQEEQVEKALFDRLAREGKHPPEETGKRNGSSIFPHRILPFSSESTWRNVWMLYAAGILLFCALSFFAYRVGMHRATDVAKRPQPQATKQEAAPTSLEEQLSDAGHDHVVVNGEIAQRDKMIADLHRQLTRQSVEINEMRAAQNQLESKLRAGDTSRQDLSQEKNELTEKMESAQSNSRSLQERLDSLAQQSAQDAAHAKASEANVNDLTRELQEQRGAVEQRDELLAHDRDIRELMGARDLYIAEIYDVAGTGETKKPYGRVFYTRGKSLIFYAYDLDQQTELKRVSTFQAWGRRGPDRQQAVNLGVFYEDNATKKRWILKCDDPKTLGQIDAVFVTVEPNGGSHKPSSKPLLFAYLKVNPNHP
jgi:hypothetical protein